MPDDQTPAEDQAPDETLDAQDDVAALQAEVQALKEQVLRYAAEAENTRRRAEREANDARAYAIQKFARDLLTVADTLGRALTAPPSGEGDPAVKNFVVGVEMTEKALQTAFETNGLKRIELGARRRLDLLQAVAVEGGLQLLLGHLNADDEVFHRSLVGVGRRSVQGARQVVGHAQQVAGELLDGVGARVIGLALGPAAGVLGLGGVAQHLFLEAGGLGAQGLHLVRHGRRGAVVFFGRRLVFGHRLPG